MADKDPAPKPDKVKLAGLPQWALLPLVVATVAVGIIWYRNHKQNQANAAANGPNTAIGPYAQYAGLAPDQASALAAQLQNLQYGFSNLDLTPKMPPQQWTSWTAGTETLNDMAQISNTTAQSIIDNTTASAGGNLSQELADYFSAGEFDAPLPAGATVAVPVFQPSTATSGNTPPPIGQGNPPIGSVIPIGSQG